MNSSDFGGDKRGIKRRMGSCFSQSEEEEDETVRMAKVLSGISFFRMHSMRQLELLSMAMREVTFKANHLLFQKGDHEESFYILKNAADVAKLSFTDFTGNLEEFTPSCFGETGLRYNNAKFHFGLFCKEPISIYTLTPHEYRRVIVNQAKEQESQFLQFLRKVPILKMLTEEQLQALGRSLNYETFETDSKIISQGSRGSTFYFIETGVVKCLQRTQKGSNEVITEVNRYAAGDYFGEGALLQDAPRNADCIAVGPVNCLTLSRSDFNDILGGLQQLLEHNFRARVLKGVELLSTLTDAERSELTDLLVEQTFEAEEQIIKQGDTGDKFYIIKEGEVRFTRNATDIVVGDSVLLDSMPKTDASDEIGRLFTGQYFGEGALLTEAPRRASAFAVDQVTLLSLDRSIFNSVFDQSLQDMLNRNFEKRRGQEDRDTVVEFKDLEQIKVLGAGSYGQVLLVTDKVTGKTYALKSMLKQRIRETKQEEHVRNERNVLASIQHPFVVSLRQSYSDNEYVFVLLEAVLGGELYAYMRGSGRLKLRDSLFYIAQCVVVFEYLHSHNIVYRDLKPENLLVASNGYLKFTDFGLAKVIDSECKTYTLCGTPAYAAPEVYNLSGHGKGVDWWTLGVLTHELLSATTPFDGDAEEIFESMELYARAYPNIRLPRGLSGDIGDLCLKLLNPNPNKRLGCGPRGRDARDIKMHGIFRAFRWTALIREEVSAPFKPKIKSMYDTGNFYTPHLTSRPIHLDNVDPQNVQVSAEWNF